MLPFKLIFIILTGSINSEFYKEEKRLESD